MPGNVQYVLVHDFVGGRGLIGAVSQRIPESILVNLNGKLYLRVETRPTSDHQSLQVRPLDLSGAGWFQVNRSDVTELQGAIR